MSIVVPSESNTSNWAGQGGQGAIMVYQIDRGPVVSSPVTRQWPLAAALTRPVASIVEPPQEHLPNVIKTLPSIAKPSANGAQKVLGNGGPCSGTQAIAESGKGLLCRLGDWVHENPVLALGLIAGTYLIAKGK